MTKKYTKGMVDRVAKQQATKTKQTNQPVEVVPLVDVQEAVPKRWAVWLERLRANVGTSAFAKVYVAFSLLALLTTTLLWALLGAKVHLGNADQLVNSFLFEHVSTFRDATLPGQHTFLFKWPLFLLVKLVGLTPGAFTIATVAAVLATVFLLVLVLYRIERRPLVFGTLCLALSLALLMVPAQPYAGALLPVNMAMLTTRNLEYVLYIVALVLFVRAPRVRSGKFWMAVGLMTVLIASDKLFLSIGAGAALLALFMYVFARRWDLATASANWLLGMVLSGAAAVALLWAVNAVGITHIAGQANAGPYGFVHSSHGFVLGAVYAVLGVLTNLGANPAFDARTLGQLPHTAIGHLRGGGFAYLVTLAIAAAGTLAAAVLVRRSLVRRATDAIDTDSPSKLSLMMVWTTIAACGAFVASNHYYMVDARYLAIALFTIFICLATAGRRLQWPAQWLAGIGAVITVSLMVGAGVAVHTYHDEQTALAALNKRDAVVAHVLAQHHVKVLVGDYWRVIPSRLAANNKLNVMPLEACTQARQILSSKAWQPELKANGFAYLLSLDLHTTDYPSCDLKQIVNTYGRPNASTLIAGTLDHPSELLLFFDRGALHSAPKTPAPARGPATVVPISLDELPNTSCNGPSVMNVVAHQDDDLLFMNPDLGHDLRAGHCVRTVYTTAGDAGSGSFYWLGRQQGAEAAYATMLNTADIWVQRIVKLSGGQFITVANPRGNTKVSLIFMNLPDGNLKGEGFRSSSYEGLARLEAGQIKEMQTVDGQSKYTSEQLVAALTQLMHAYQPGEVRTQSNYNGKIYPDHSDHMATGRYAQRAHNAYDMQQFAGAVTIPIHFYIGYPIHEMAPNVTDGDLQQKTEAFAAYAQFDNAVCAVMHPCKFAPVFQAYLGRQYQSEQ